MKKLLALVLAAMMLMAMMTTAMAANADMTGQGTEDGVIGEYTAQDTQTKYGNTVILYKEIKAYNETAGSVYAPTITYNYTIAPGAAGAQVKDAGGVALHKSKNAVEVQTKAGPDGAKISGSVDNGDNYTDGQLVFTPAVSLNTSTDGTKNVFKLKVDLSGVEWKAAGVYRYIITETTTEAQKNAAGIADGTSTETRYLDVYVMDGETTGTYQVYGYVCFQTLGSIDGTVQDTVTKAAKTEGFVADNGGEQGTTALTADQYYTFNLKVSKTLVGDQAMNDHKFPFFVNIKNSSVTADIKLKTTTVEDGGTAADGDDKAGNLSAETGLADTPTIDHQSNITYIGIPVGITAATTADVYENNDVTGTTYLSQFSIDTAAATDESKKSISWITTGNANKSIVAQWAEVDMNKANEDTHAVDFTNTLEVISPTGVVMRVAPYALILGAGLMLLLISRKRKVAIEEE